ncbi:cold shock and DUF1294 domain-containing protein [filamentous cyanobacterium LEGE 11480]|uniref:Cold shock and DUF1294 domain-containing protein n=1 Tax=Romeriopsis navalis LEGE 11480 TaxID=2777977 RepID=A0A928VJ08_9CYAN|nr:DUF1294 domain-containing protein [Romeriopsis navalis]MBE9028643.1 cold shock and DUF1294 domain-containing protein [Romeriopsis navalis LEGE 11480]
MKSSLRSGQLIKWKDDQGFGFIKPIDNTHEIFLHITEVRDATRRPIVGDTIYYRTSEQNGKVHASDAFILGARLSANSQHSSATPKNAVQGRSRTSSLLLETSLITVFPLIGAIHFGLTTNNSIPLFLYLTISIVSFTLYSDDKSRAQQKAWRIPEQTLILCDLAGGWIGGFIAQRKLRHKVSKSSYQFAFWLVVMMHHIVWLGWLISGKNLMG